MTTGRFAPSPSGRLHLGSLRTAILAWCHARHDGGRFLIRMEDLTTGAAPREEQRQLRELATIGITSDLPIVRQSERTVLYRDAIETLAAMDLTYPCYCSRREVRDAAAAPHGRSIDGAYPGTCATLSSAERAAREESGRRPALRLRADAAVVGVEDLRVGRVEREVDDFVLRRGDGVAAYNLAVVVDDADQGVDQVVRGDDLLDTTPRQVLLQRLLGLATPRYVHVPLVVGPDGERLAKRHGSITLEDLERRGRSTEQVLGAIAASMGLASSGDELDLAAIVAGFDPAAPLDPVWVADPALI